MNKLILLVIVLTASVQASASNCANLYNERDQIVEELGNNPPPDRVRDLMLRLDIVNFRISVYNCEFEEAPEPQ